MYKRFYCLSALFVALALTLYGCAGASATTVNGVPDSLNYKKVEPLKDYQITYALYAPTSEEEQIKYSDLIFKGIVLDVSEYSVNDKYSSYVGLIKYKITDVIYSMDENIQKDDEIYLLTNVTSRIWPSDSIQQNVNDEYILFARLNTDTDPENPFRFFYSTTKYYLNSSFMGVVTLTGNNAKFDAVYSTLANKANKSTRIKYKNESSDCYVMNEQDFITELVNLIQLYKNPEPTMTPTIEPSIEPTIEPSIEPTIGPSIEPTPAEETEASPETVMPEGT